MTLYRAEARVGRDWRNGGKEVTSSTESKSHELERWDVMNL